MDKLYRRDWPWTGERSNLELLKTEKSHGLCHLMTVFLLQKWYFRSRESMFRFPLRKKFHFRPFHCPRGSLRWRCWHHRLVQCISVFSYPKNNCIHNRDVIFPWNNTWPQHWLINLRHKHGQCNVSSRYRTRCWRQLIYCDSIALSPVDRLTLHKVLITE